MSDSPLKLTLKDSVRSDIEQVLLHRLTDAIEGASGRDDDLRDYDMLLDGKMLPLLSEPWPESCHLVDPIAWEQRTALLANLALPLKRDPLVMVKSRRPEFETPARLQEAWLGDTWQIENFKDAFYDYLSNLLRDKNGILYSGWADKTQRQRGVRYWDGNSLDDDGDPVLIQAANKDPDTDYKIVPVTEPGEDKQGGDYRCVDQVNFYPFPANVTSLPKATMTFERMFLTESELLEGIERFDYDADAVMELINNGPTHDQTGNDYQERQERAEGVEGTALYGDGAYECFLFFGRLPKLWDGAGHAALPKHYWNDLFTGMLCGARNITFKLDFCEYPGYPYFIGSLDPKANRLNGSGMVEKLEPLAYEATHLLRSTMNALDFEMQPMIVQDDDSYKMNKSNSAYPGAVWRKAVGGEVAPMQTTKSSLMGFQGFEMVIERARSMASNKTYGNLDNKKRTNLEIQNMSGAVDQKFDLYQWNAYKILPHLAKWRVQLEMHFNPQIEQQIQTAKGVQTIKASDLNSEVLYMVAQTSADSNPDTRAQKDGLIQKIQVAFFQLVQSFPLFAGYLWAGARMSLLDLDVRDVEEIIGPEPPPPAEIQAQQAGMIQQQQMQQAAMGTPGGMPLPPAALPHPQ